MDAKTIVELSCKHTLFSWVAQRGISPLPIDRAEGVYVYTADGRRLLDFCSQMFSVNIGHGHPRVREAIKAAADGLIYCAPGCATAVRARLGQRLAQMFPGHLNKFFFTLGGADANEHAIRIARHVTGRPKIIGRYRNYHGSSHATMTAGGDPRGRRLTPPLPGFLRVLDIESQRFSFGSDPDERVDGYLRYIDEVIRSEGPDQIAAMIVEVLPGSNGALVPPAGYLKPLAELLHDHGALLICDEVMTGFGRTGRMFGFEHHDVVPDIATVAKGITSSYVPLGAVAVSDAIAAFYDDHPFTSGLTYSAHPFLLEVADAVLDVLVEERLVDNAAAMGEILAERLGEIERGHASVHAVRSQGLFAAIEIRPDLAATATADPDRGFGAPIHRQVIGGLRQRGLYTVMRYNNLFVAPPLVIDRAELTAGLDLIDAQLSEIDDAAK